MAMANSLAALKSSVYAVQLGLFEGIASDAQLQAAGKVLTRSEYADVVTERTIVNLCGYPLCTHHLPESFPRKGRYHISLREHKVYDLQETRLFCSSDCLVSSQSFAASLPLDRDYTEEILELAAAFHDLGLQDVDHHHEASCEIGKHMQKPTPQQEVDPCLCEQTRPSAMEIGDATPSIVHVSKLDPLSIPLVEGEESTTKQPQELNPGTFLLIHEQEQAEIKVDDFCTAGPSNAIEGYIPQREFHHKKLSGHEKDDMAVFSSRHGSKEKQGDILRKKEKERSGSGKKKQASDCKTKSSDIGFSNGLGTGFSSSILVDDVMSTTSEARHSGEPVSKCSPAENSFTSCIIMNKKASTQRHRPPKKPNRVSWADHNNLKLVEESSSSFVSSSSRTPEYSHNVQVPTEERDHDEMSEISSFGKAAVMVEESNGLLSSQERFSSEEGHNTAPINNIRDDNLECAKALVAALTEAAEAVAHGDADSSEAVARAGISILSCHERPSNQLLDHLKEEQKESEKESANDLENADPKDCWYSAPPKDFKPELSTFGTLWMALDGWISAASIAYVYGRDLNDEDDFAFVNGKEYLRQVIIPNGISAEIERTLAGCISRALPALVETLRFPVPVSTLELSLGRFLRTMSFVTAIPPFRSKQWQVVVLLFLDALSVHCLPALRTRFLNGRPMIQKVLDSSNITEAEYEVFRDLVLPMGMLPEFAAHCGG